MASLRSVLSSLSALLRPSRAPRKAAPRPAPAGRRTPRPAPHGAPLAEPGRTGAGPTREVDPRTLGRIRTAYQPILDGDADPGEIVWTWVPYEEADGRGKDRPVLVVATEPSGSVLALALTSQEHPERPDYLPVGSGDWDGRHRPSYVRLDRVFRVHQSGMRREAAALDAPHFETVRRALAARYGWR